MVNSFVRDVILKFADKYEYKRIYKLSKIYSNIHSFISILWWCNVKALRNPNKYFNEILETRTQEFKKVLERAKEACTDALLGKYSFCHCVKNTVVRFIVAACSRSISK